MSFDGFDPVVARVLRELGHRDGTLKIDDARLAGLVECVFECSVEACCQLVAVATELQRVGAKTAVAQLSLIIASAIESIPPDAWNELPPAKVATLQQSTATLPVPRTQSVGLRAKR